jgi:hypothetical protein
MYAVTPVIPEAGSNAIRVITYFILLGVVVMLRQSRVMIQGKDFKKS